MPTREFLEIVLSGWGSVQRDLADGVYTAHQSDGEAMSVDGFDQGATKEHEWDAFASTILVAQRPVVGRTGLYAVVGGPGSGKTQYLANLAAQPDSTYLRCAEPDGLSTQPHPGVVPHALNACRTRRVVLDGLRYTAMVPGRAGTAEGGLSRDYALLATLLNHWAKRTDRTIVAALNLMSQHEGGVAAVIDQLAASCQGVLIFHSTTVKGDSRLSAKGEATFRHGHRGRKTFVTTTYLPREV
jgi:hypothetical protein